MLVTEYAKNLGLLLKELERVNRPFAVAVKTVTKDMGERIFIQGKRSDGSQIGQYDTTHPLYVNPKKVAGAATGNKSLNISGLNPPTGKHGDTVFKSGKKAGQPHKTTYVSSYKEFRSRVGRPVDKVNLVLSGDLQSDFINTKRIDANHYETVLSRDINQKKMENFNDKYGTISHTTKQEENKLTIISLKELLVDLKKFNLA